MSRDRDSYEEYFFVSSTSAYARGLIFRCYMALYARRRRRTCVLRRSFVGPSSVDAKDPTLKLKTQKLMQEYARAADCRQTLIGMGDCTEDDDDEFRRDAKALAKSSQGKSHLLPWRRGESYSVLEQMDMIKEGDKIAEEKRGAEEKAIEERSKQKVEAQKQKTEVLEAILFKSTAKLNDYDNYEISELRRQHRGNNDGFSKDSYISLVSSRIVGKLRVDPDSS